MKKQDIFLIIKAFIIWAIIVSIGFMSTIAVSSLLLSIMITAIGVGLWCLSRDCVFYCKLATT